MTRSLARGVIPAAAAFAVAMAPVRVGAQAASGERAARFTIAATTDSTLSFGVGSTGWIRAGQRGIAVDERRRDALVARFTVLTVDHGVALALVTGETTRVTTAHVAVLERPPTPLWRRGAFWGGTALGAVVGLAVGSLF